MSDNFKLLRFYFVLLALFTVGRWGLSLGGAEYDKTHQVFSIVILTNISAAYYGLLTRSSGGGVKRAMVLGVLLGVTSQVVIFASTVASYALGMDTFFNHPRALNVEEAIPLGQAVVGRTITFVANVVTNTIIGALGWLIAGVNPRMS